MYFFFSLSIIGFGSLIPCTGVFWSSLLALFLPWLAIVSRFFQLHCPWDNFSLRLPFKQNKQTSAADLVLHLILRLWGGDCSVSGRGVVPIGGIQRLLEFQLLSCTSCFTSLGSW